MTRLFCLLGVVLTASGVRGQPVLGTLTGLRDISGPGST